MCASSGVTMDDRAMANSISLIRICAFKETNSYEQGTVIGWISWIDNGGCFNINCICASQVTVAITESGASKSTSPEESNTERSEGSA